MSNKFALPAIIAAIVLLTGTLGYMSPNFVEATTGPECEGKCMDAWSKKIEKCEEKEIKCEDILTKCEDNVEASFERCEDAGAPTCEDHFEDAMMKCEENAVKCGEQVDKCLQGE